MSPTFRYFFSLLIALATSGQLTAQEVKKTDSVRNRFLPTGLRLGTDVISIIKSTSKGNFNGWEANADVDFSRYYLAVDYGKWSREEDISNGHYKNNGTYYRIGVDVNFLLKDPDKNMFFLGFRYGRSMFEENLNYTYINPIFGNMSQSISTAGLRGHWGEITTGLRVKIFPGFWMGYLARLKFAPGVAGAGAQQPYDIPGYGLAEHAPWWGFNYQLFWRIPFRPK